MKRTAVAAALVSCVAGAPALADSWRVTGIGGVATVGEAEIDFGADGRIAIGTGCNRVSLGGRMDGSVLVPEGPMLSTRMACAGALDRQEKAFVMLFSDRVAMTYDPFADRIILAGQGIEAVLERKTVAVTPIEMPWQPHAGRAAPEGVPPYLGVFGLADDLPIRAAASADAAVLGALPSGTVLRNGGCDGGWCAVELPDGTVSGFAEADWLEPAGGALRGGQALFDATASLPCGLGHGAPMVPCPAGVAREGSGTATVVVRLPDGRDRALFFEAGDFLAADASEAGGGFDTGAERRGDLTRVRVDEEYFEIPDAFLTGG